MMRHLAVVMVLATWPALADDTKAETKAKEMGVDRESVERDMKKTEGLGCKELEALVKAAVLEKHMRGSDLTYLQWRTALGAKDERVREKTCGVQAGRLQKRFNKAPAFSGTLDAKCEELQKSIEAKCFGESPAEPCKNVIRMWLQGGMSCEMAQKMYRL